MPTLLLIDDHPLFVDGFSGMIREWRPDWRILTGPSSQTGCALLAESATIDLAIVDLQLPDADGFETIGQMAIIAPAVPRMIISGREDAVAQAKAARCGASGYLVKTASPETMIALIESVLAGGTGFAGALDVVAQSPSLSPRQMEVLALLSEGCANKEIRYRLGIAERTVRAHLTELFHALGAQSRVQALLRARQLGLIA